MWTGVKLKMAQRVANLARSGVNLGQDGKEQGGGLRRQPVGETCLFVCFVDIFNMDLGSGGRDGPRGLNEPQ